MGKSVYTPLALEYGWLDVGLYIDLPFYLMIKQQHFYYH